MKAFLDKDFLLNTPMAVKLYHEAAESCPIIDYHCHISPQQIFENLRYENITQVWLGGDHYKWRFMRCAGIDEKYITGDASDHDKFIAYATVVGKAIGNPLHHWSHLELRRYFGYEGILNKDTAEEVWNLCNAKLQEENMSVRGLIRQSNVETICTTDDPIDTLEWHQKLAKDSSFKTAVLPAWRPDKAMMLYKPDYVDYIAKLSEVSGVEITGWPELKQALKTRMEYFAQNGCCLSDHGPVRFHFAPADDETINEILQNRLKGQQASPGEQAMFQTAFLLFCAECYRELGWVMQLHYGCLRDNNPRMFEKIGVDTGFDAMGDFDSAAQLSGFMGALEQKDALPKTIIYSLNPHENQVIDVMCGCFQNSEAVSKIQHGSAWWFNDHFQGMTDQLSSLASLGYLAGFVGMLTDSRSFLSYPRHEYFRRILCRLLGQWVEDGFFPEDEERLMEIVRGISYQNAKNYFSFAEKN
ncbi:MAG: glucuronate isomerase [Clostridiales bacterium]|nr:glucuronate isomerase [Clostridiales bacterium]